LRHKIEQLRNENGIDSERTSSTSFRAELDAILDRMIDLRENYYIPILHTNGCGDFTMASRADWFLLRGYPEWQVFSWAIDSVIIFQGHFNGIPIEEIPGNLTHYHIEHDYGSGWTPEGSASLWARLDQQGIPYLSYDDFVAITRELQRNAANGAFTVYNDLSWGYLDREIECLEIVKPGSVARAARQRNTGPLTESLALECIMHIPLERAVCHDATQARSELRRSASNELEVAVETGPDLWSYSLAFDIAEFASVTPDGWLCISLCVDVGSVFVGILSADRSDFLVQTECRGPNKDFVDINMFIKNTSRVGEVVFRNGCQDGPARFRVRSLQVMREPETAPLDDDGGSDATLRALDIPEAIIRMLPGQQATGAAEPPPQTLVILPVGATPAVIDLDASHQNGGELVLELHVIMGEATIALGPPGGDAVVIEHREPLGVPLTRVHMAVDADVGSLIISGAADCKTAVLLHSVKMANKCVRVQPRLAAVRSR
jgi:hypothetical protein